MDMTEVVFCGRRFDGTELQLICAVVTRCSGLSRMELAHTLCELLQWQRPGGGLKARECREFLERLDARGCCSCRPNVPPSRWVVPQACR